MTNAKPRTVKARYCDTKVEVQQYAEPIAIGIHEPSHEVVSIQRQGELRDYLLSNLKDTKTVLDIMSGAKKVLKEKRAILLDTAVSIAAREMYGNKSKEFDAVRTALRRYLSDETIPQSHLDLLAA